MKSRFVTLCCLLCLAGLAFGMVSLTLSAAEATRPAATVMAHSWYYKPREDAGQPIVADDAPFLSRYPHISMGSAVEKQLCLTFDCGYDNGNTGLILDVLEQKQVPAVFFVTGHFIDSNPDLIRRMVAEGHLVGNHGNTHKDLSGVQSDTEFLKELQDLEAKYTALTGQPMAKYMRPPEGKYSETMLQLCQKHGYTPVFWSFAYRDWLTDDQPSHTEAKAIIRARTHPGEIALLHATSSTNAAILGEVIDDWQANGYRLVSLQEMVA